MPYAKPQPKHARKALWLTLPSAKKDAERAKVRKLKRVKQPRALNFVYHSFTATSFKKLIKKHGDPLEKYVRDEAIKASRIINRNRIRPATKATAARRREYNSRVKVWIKGKFCQVAFRARESGFESAVIPQATQCHHKFGRRGRLLLWEPGWIPVSDEGHRWLGDHPKEARELGLICPQGSWNDFEKALQSQAACAYRFMGD